MIAPHRIHGTDYALCVKHGKRVKVGEACPLCPSTSKPAPVAQDAGRAKGRASGKHRCVLGHNHDSGGEAESCPRVYSEGAQHGLTTFRPGRPGIPCFRIAPDDATGRPIYVSVDWVLVDAVGKVALVVDYKGAVLMSKRFRGASDWVRAKRIIASETGAPVVELESPNEVGAALDRALNQSARAEGGEK